MHNASFHSSAFLETLGFKSLGVNVKIHSSVVLIGCHNISLGNNIRIDPFTIISAGKRIVIGSNVHIAAHCMLAGSETIEIGDFAGISHGVKLLSSTDDFMGGFLSGPTVPEKFRKVHSRPVKFGRHCIAGANSVILPGASIGTGATIGALSLAKGVVDPWIIAAGVPVKKVGDRDGEMILIKEASYLSDGEQSDN